MQRCIVKLAQTLAGQDDDVQVVQFGTVVSEGLAGNAFYLVAFFLAMTSPNRG